MVVRVLAPPPVLDRRQRQMCIRDSSKIEVGVDDLALGLPDVEFGRGLVRQVRGHDGVGHVHHFLAPSHRRFPAGDVVELGREGGGDHVSERFPLLGQAQLGLELADAAECRNDLRVEDLMQCLDDAALVSEGG